MSRPAAASPDFDQLDELIQLDGRHGDVLDRLAELEAQLEAVLSEYVVSAAS